MATIQRRTEVDTEAFEQRYMALFWRRQWLQWENYATDAAHDLSVVDAEVYRLACAYRDWTGRGGRREGLLRSVAMRERVDKHPEVAALRNRLDDWRHYEGGLTLVERSDRLHYRLTMAQRMRPDVLQLMALRTRLAREAGFSSYVALALAVEGLPYAPLVSFLKGTLARGIPRARALIRAFDLSWKDWFARLTRIGHPIPSDPAERMVGFLRALGYGPLRERMQLVVRDGPIAGYVGVVAPQEVRILLRPGTSLHDWLTLHHELGHAVAHTASEARGIYGTWSAVFDESMATLAEWIAVYDALAPAQRAAAEALFLLEGVRCAISALFELALWEQPEAAERLYVAHFGQLGLPVPHPEIWAADSFRSIDPVTIHSYAIGYQLAARTVRHLDGLYGTDLRAWGGWLREHYYHDGRRRPLVEKAEAVGGLFVQEG